MFEYRGLVSHDSHMKENANQIQENPAKGSIPKKTALGEVQNKLPSTPSLQNNPQKPKSYFKPQLQQFTKPNIVPNPPAGVTAPRMKIQPKKNLFWIPQVLQPDDLEESWAKLWLPSDKVFDEFLDSLHSNQYEDDDMLPFEPPPLCEQFEEVIEPPKLEMQFPDIELPELDIDAIDDLIDDPTSLNQNTIKFPFF